MCIVLVSHSRLAGATTVESAIRGASVGWKTVQLEGFSAYDALLGADPSIMSLSDTQHVCQWGESNAGQFTWWAEVGSEKWGFSYLTQFPGSVLLTRTFDDTSRGWTV